MAISRQLLKLPTEDLLRRMGQEEHLFGERIHAPLVTEAKIPTLVLSSGASITVTKSPYMVRAGFLQSQQAWIMAEWAAKNGSKRVVRLVNDWAPGIESETAFRARFMQAGGEIIEAIRIPLANPDFAPFLQRVRDLNPDTAFIYFAGPQASIFAKQFAERGLANSGIKIIGPGDLTDDNDLNTMGDQMLGMITSGSYSAAHDSARGRACKRDPRNLVRGPGGWHRDRGGAVRQRHARRQAARERPARRRPAARLLQPASDLVSPVPG